MKKDDAKQNAAPGCSMVGTVTNCDDCQDWSPVACDGCSGGKKLGSSMR